MTIKMNENEKLVLRGLSGARWVALGALVQKVVSVLLNQVSMRLVNADALGVARTKLDLVLSAILVCREGFRLALVREKIGDAQQLGLALVPAFFGTLLSVGLAASTLDGPFRLFCLAAFLEVATEPLHSLSLVQMIAAPRALADTLGALLSGIALVILLTKTDVDHLSALALSRAAHSVGICVGRVIGWRNNVFWRRPPEMPTLPLLKGSFWLCAQAALKQVLSDCDKLALSYIATPSVSGIYALANNYGSLIARVTLQPTEEAARSVFSAMKKQNASSFERERGATVLSGLLKAAVYFGLFFACLGTFYAPIATRLLLRRGDDNLELGRALAAFCVLVPCLALNGVSEAYVQATGDASSLRRLASVHVVSTLAFLAISLSLASVDASALVLVNAAATLLRVSLVFTVVDRHLLRSRFLPHPISVASFAVAAALAAAVTRANSELASISVGAFIAFALVLISYQTERKFIADVSQRLKDSSNKSD